MTTLLLAAALLAAPASPQIEFNYACNDAAKTHLAQGLDAADNLRNEQAQEHFQKALDADPKCLDAKVLLATTQSGPVFKKTMDEVDAQLTSAPELEKQLVAILDAGRNGDAQKAFELASKLRDANPNVYRAQLLFSNNALPLEKWDLVLDATKKAAALNPKAGAPYINMGYANLFTHKTVDAVAAFKKYTEVTPSEPNGFDSLGDALLADGKYAEAVTQYQKAIDVSKGAFWQSWNGIATAKALQGDYDGARAALVNEHSAAPQPFNKITSLRFTAGTWFAQGKWDDGFKVLDQAEKEAADAKLDPQLAFGHLIRAFWLQEAGKHADSLAEIAAAEKVPSATMNPGQKVAVGEGALLDKVVAHAAMGHLDEAKAALGALKKSIGARADPGARDTAALAEGALAAAKKDDKAAAAALGKCSELNYQCRAMLISVLDRVDAAGAKAARALFVSSPSRGSQYIYYRARLFKPEGKGSSAGSR